jgi:hypothetical protein
VALTRVVEWLEVSIQKKNYTPRFDSSANCNFDFEIERPNAQCTRLLFSSHGSLVANTEATLMPCLDAYVSISTHMCWSGLV